MDVLATLDSAIADLKDGVPHVAKCKLERLRAVLAAPAQAPVCSACGFAHGSDQCPAGEPDQPAPEADPRQTVSPQFVSFEMPAPEADAAGEARPLYCDCGQPAVVGMYDTTSTPESSTTRFRRAYCARHDPLRRK